jgi:hypothetical protein
VVVDGSFLFTKKSSFETAAPHNPRILLAEKPVFACIWQSVCVLLPLSPLYLNPLKTETAQRKPGDSFLSHPGRATI